MDALTMQKRLYLAYQYEWLIDRGLSYKDIEEGSECFACFEEFLQNEYRDHNTVIALCKSMTPEMAVDTLQRYNIENNVYLQLSTRILTEGWLKCDNGEYIYQYPDAHECVVYEVFGEVNGVYQMVEDGVLDCEYGSVRVEELLEAIYMWKDVSAEWLCGPDMTIPSTEAEGLRLLRSLGLKFEGDDKIKIIRDGREIVLSDDEVLRCYHALLKKDKDDERGGRKAAVREYAKKNGIEITDALLECVLDTLQDYADEGCDADWIVGDGLDEAFEEAKITLKRREEVVGS